MRYVLYAVGALLLIVLVVVVTGWLLPVKHHASRQTTYPVPPATIFALITTVSDFPSWRSTVKRVELLPDANGKRQFREVGRDGTILYSIDTLLPDQRLVTRIADPSLPFGGGWTYELIPDAAGTSLRITEDGEVYNPVFRFVSRFVLGHHATIDTYLRDVGKRLGHDVSISS